MGWSIALGAAGILLINFVLTSGIVFLLSKIDERPKND